MAVHLSETQVSLPACLKVYGNVTAAVVNMVSVCSYDH